MNDSSTSAVDTWLADYRAAWVNRDPEAAGALFTEDATYAEMPYDEPLQGDKGVRDYWTRVTATQADIEVQYGEALVAGDRAAVEWWVTMTNGGMPMTLAGSFMLRFAEDGRCRELREYWHFGEDRLAPKPGWGR
jgi:uncharacterized protein (TIGR02246 family)